MDKNERESTYDSSLRDIQHFRLHPELLPFVGTGYSTYKILLIGESHYLPKDTGVMPADFADWYKTATSAVFSARDREYFTTRTVVSTFLGGDRRGDGGRTMFSRPEAAWQEILGDPRATFDSFAFFNYFQRPERRHGNSIDADATDREQAYVIAENIFAVLQPDLIVFLSKRAYNAYIGEREKHVDHYDTRLCRTSHPTCPWWYRSKKWGKQHFVKEVETYLTSCGYLPERDLTLAENAV